MLQTTRRTQTPNLVRLKVHLRTIAVWGIRGAIDKEEGALHIAVGRVGGVRRGSPWAVAGADAGDLEGDAHKGVSRILNGVRRRTRR
ncbi:hypothetical protein BHM03_00003670 [Ensete ventricosum]|nr:hypothetical protein BHM03_00003670 [Ensete ventricosum]